MDKGRKRLELVLSTGHGDGWGFCTISIAGHS